MPVDYWVNELGLSSITNHSELVAILESFDAWQSITTASIRFNYRGPTPVRTAGRDGINLVTFADDRAPLGSGTLAATLSFIAVDGDELRLSEADIVVNAAQAWSTTGDPNTFDIQSVVRHEIGHLLGLGHSPLMSSVMTPYGAPGNPEQRALSYDDIAGVSELYPGALPPTGQIEGFVTSNYLSIYAAHVVAVDDTGTNIVSTITQPDGSYTLSLLPAGTYKIYAEPLDGPFTAANFGSITSPANLDFCTTFFGDTSTFELATPITVAPGSSYRADIGTLPPNTTGLNVTFPDTTSRVARDTVNQMTVAGTDISPGIRFSAGNTDISVSEQTFGTSTSPMFPTLARILVGPSGTTPLGSKNIMVSRGTDLAIASGAIVIVEGRPSIQAISPVEGTTDGRTLVSITGNNFRPGARVYFGGLSALEVRVLSPAMLQAVTPASPGGPVVVQVFNDDGTQARLLNGYRYQPIFPTITNVSPSSAAPGAIVTIEGERFGDALSQVLVLFDGTRAQVLSLTPTRIEAIVPYVPLPRGMISVLVQGVRNNWTGFTIMRSAASTNTATPPYTAVDASPAAGGTTLNFPSNDDAISIVLLPFNFALFRQTYFAGAGIAVCTNGWMTFDLSAGPQAQNQPNWRDNPASLIAPFFDNLEIIPARSTVSTRIVGAEPNRSFIVQWSDMRILDDDGHPLDANVTFQAILFEGSNDIEFRYISAQGPRADGVSAAIGLQDFFRDSVIGVTNGGSIRPYLVISYRFAEGRYDSVGVDTTPPRVPTVWDEGPVTNRTSDLAASWDWDPNFRTATFEYAVGGSPGSTEVIPFTPTRTTSVVVRNLKLEPGKKYYFAVRTVSAAGGVSEAGISDGILVDPNASVTSIVVPQPLLTGLALLSPTKTSVLLKAMSNDGEMIPLFDRRNPVMIDLDPGVPYAQLVDRIFGVNGFTGWIEIRSFSPNLRVYSLGADAGFSSADGAAPAVLSSDFMLIHPAGEAYLVNPSEKEAAVTLTDFPDGATRTLIVPPQNQVSTMISSVTRVRSSQPIASLQLVADPDVMAALTGQPLSAVRNDLTFPFAVNGSGYQSTLTIVNTDVQPRDATITFETITKTVHLEPQSAQTLNLSRFLGLSDGVQTGPVRLHSTPPAFSTGSLLGDVYIANEQAATFVTAPVPSREIVFNHVADAFGFFTGLSIASEDQGTTVTIDVYPPDGGTPASAAVKLGPKSFISGLLGEIVPGVTAQIGGYIRILADQPITAWEIYGTNQSMSSAPPQ